MKNADSITGGLAEIQFSPSGRADISTMTLKDTSGHETSYAVNQHALGTLLHQVLNFAASTWRHKPELALETVSRLMQAFPAQEMISMQTINDADYAIKIDLGKIELALFVPEASGWNRRQYGRVNHEGAQIHRRRASDIHLGPSGP